MSDKVKGLRQEHDKLLTEAQGLVTAAEEEGGSFDETQFKAIHERMRDLREKADALEGAAERVAAEREYQESREEAIVGELAEQGFDEEQRANVRNDIEERKQLHLNAFRKYMLAGPDRMSKDEWRAIQTRPTENGEERAAQLQYEERASNLVVGTSNLGGVLVPEDFEATVVAAMKDFSGLRGVARVLPTNTGRDLPVPTLDDVANTGSRVAEGSTGSVSDPTFANVVMRAHDYQSGPITVSLDLFQDSAIPPEQLVSDVLGARLGRVTAKEYIDGTGGAAAPSGIINMDSSDSAVAIASATALSFTNLYSLKHGVDVAYRRMPNAGWLLHDNTFETISKLQDGNSNFLLQPRVTEGAPQMLLGHPVTIDNSSTAMVSNAGSTSVKLIAFGDLARYWIRDVRGMQLFRLNERFMLNRQIGFIGFLRSDGRGISATTVAAQKPIRFLVENT